MRKLVLILTLVGFVGACEDANDHIEGLWDGCRGSGTNEVFCAFSTFGQTVWWPVLRGFEEMDR